ncbi:hypothetical protein Sste5346_006150 [Sporothrix stenoceras]|uniref:Zn(2)-C6 fungal-type domain-containing protein n=1 Tax=Sporothrix stenoceras TaxID=5173 RepID=A0ABR3Z059_9PEZI
MVSQTYGHHGTDKRHNRAFSPYVGSSGYAEARVYVPTQPDTRTLMSEHQNDRTEPPTRRRIAVACGRCRQRKIRCSGDLGQNIPCSNCKNAGVTQCLFLRVSSRETPIKSDLALGSMGNYGSLGSLGALRNEFNYNPVIARALASRSAVGPPPPPPPPQQHPPSSSYSTCSSGSSNDFNVGEPFRSSSLYPYANKSYFSSMSSPWGAGYGEDCVDYTIPTCSPYAVVNDASGHLVSYQPWDARSKQQAPGVVAASDTTDTPSPTMPPPPLSVPPTVSTKSTDGSNTPGPSPVHSTHHSSSGNSNNNNTSGLSSSLPNTTSGTTNLVYRLATAVDNTDDYRHATSPLNASMARTSIEGIERLLGNEPSMGRPLLGPSITSSMASKSAADFVARSAAPSPAPHPQSHHSIHTGYTTSHLTGSADRVSSLNSSLGYSTRSSPVEHHHSAYGPSSSSSGGNNSSNISDGGLFSDQDRDVGLQGSSGGPSSAASYLDSYTYEPGPPPPPPPQRTPSTSLSGSLGLGTGMSRQKSNKKKTASTESLGQKANSSAGTPTTHRMYNPTDGPAAPPLSRPSSPPMYAQQHHDSRNETLCSENHGHLQHVQHTSGYRM